jgi:hypothetical protein
MIRIKISNPDLSGEEKTNLDADYSSGTTLTVRNSDNFTTNWFAVVGEPGQERTEADYVASTTSTTIVLNSGLSYSHNKSAPVYRSHYNQVSVERKPSGGSYAQIAEGLIDIEWDNSDKNTFVTISAGQSTDTFKWRFYNSVTSEYTAYSDELAGTGVARNQLGHIIELVKKNPIAKNVDIETIISYANDFQDVAYDEMPKAWWFQKTGTAISTVADTYTYSIDDNWSDLLSIKFVLYRYVNGSVDETYPLTYSPLNEFYNKKTDANKPSDDYVKYWTFKPPDSSSAKGYILLDPTPDTTSCYIQPIYQFELTALDSFGDEIVVPYQKGYTDYIFYRIFNDIKNDTNNAVKYNKIVEGDLIALRKRARRQLGQPELFRWRGIKGWSKMYGGDQVRRSSTANELFW